MIKTFDQLFDQLRTKAKKKLVVAWGVDAHSITAVSKAIDAGIVDATLVGDSDMIAKICADEKIDMKKFAIIDNKNEVKSIQEAVTMVHEKKADVLMKGLCSTDKYMHGILNKDWGLLPQKAVLSHLVLMEHPNYPKLLVFGDMAVIPLPEFKQKVAIVKYAAGVCKELEITKPKIAMIAATEQMLPAMLACTEGAQIAKMSERGQVPGIVDGPLALDVAISPECAKIKKLKSEVAGDADALVFPNIESANVFYKANTQLMKGVKTAAVVVGAAAPCVLSSRGDSIDTKLNSIALACLQAK